VLGGYVLRSLYLEADILDEAGHTQRADLRRSQADAIAQAYGFDVTPADASPEALEKFLAQQGVDDGDAGDAGDGTATSDVSDSGNVSAASDATGVDDTDNTDDTDDTDRQES
jgi:hypothetical protein